uniref:hypothetical protein n=1 Tax=Pararhodobacter marinus TaxID=2184063 RepID=UPI00355993A2
PLLACGQFTPEDISGTKMLMPEAGAGRRRDAAVTPRARGTDGWRILFPRGAARRRKRACEYSFWAM